MTVMKGMKMSKVYAVYLHVPDTYSYDGVFLELQEPLYSTREKAEAAKDALLAKHKTPYSGMGDVSIEELKVD